MRMTIPIGPIGLTGLTLLLLSSAASAWQPVVYPIRSQSPWQQSMDAATCYGMANRQTNVNITREAQAPMAPKPASAVVGNSGTQVSQPPLPASGAAAASTSVAGAAAPAASAATATMPPASEATVKTGKNGMPEIAGASEPQPTTQAEMKLPPPPPPEPPMTRYWRAYGVCMQGRGYAVQ
jgi:hypothetical protein